MRFEILIQFIVPLTFLAIWALTSLLNRDSQPLPPRPGRPPGPGSGGSRPQNFIPGQTEARSTSATLSGRVPSASARSESSTAWPNADVIAAQRERSRQRPPQNLQDAIVFIENGTGARGTSRIGPGSSSSAPASSGTRSSRGAQPRRGTRGRAASSGAGAAPVVRAEPEPHRVLSESLSLQKTRPLEIAPLSAPIAGLTRTLSQATAAPDVNRAHAGDGRPALTAGDLRGLLASPGKLREMALLSELLQPPLALRHRRNRS
jgi:hypothetical protein